MAGSCSIKNLLRFGCKLFLEQHLHNNQDGGDCKKNNAIRRYFTNSYEFYRRLTNDEKGDENDAEPETDRAHSAISQPFSGLIVHITAGPRDSKPIFNATLMLPLQGGSFTNAW